MLTTENIKNIRKSFFIDDFKFYNIFFFHFRVQKYIKNSSISISQQITIFYY